MYGLVNQGLQDFAIRTGGESLWRDIQAAAGIDVGVFVGMNTYPDDLTYRLVDAASRVTGMTTDEVLRGFGRHWILYTARRGYGGIFDTMGRTLLEFLSNLDMMHTRLSLSMPDLRPPSFVCESLPDDRIRLEYRSDRDGLASMVVGLLEGLGEMYGQKLSIEHTVDRSQGGAYDEFVVEPIGAFAITNAHAGGLAKCPVDMA